MIDGCSHAGHGTVRPTVSRRTFLGCAASLGAATTTASAEDAKLPLLTLEEHFATAELERLNRVQDERFLSGGGRRPELLDVGAGRIADMDQAGIGMQVLSAVTPGAQNLPGAEGVAYARKLNAWVANEVIPGYPDRFRVFATLPLSQPGAAADELDRSVREHGFVGCMSYGAVDGKYLDHVDFEPVTGRAEALGVPIYIHPNWASPQAADVFYDGLGDEVLSRILGGPGYGWHQEVALQCLRMIAGDVLDRHPNLQAVVGHMGEGLPFADYIEDLTGPSLAYNPPSLSDSPTQQHVLAATANFPFVATENCTPWWLAGSAPCSTLLTSSTGRERGSDARMGDEDVAEALPGPGRLEGRVVEALRGESADDPRVGRDGAAGPRPVVGWLALLAATAGAPQAGSGEQLGDGGAVPVGVALEFQVLTAVRSGEVRGALWGAVGGVSLPANDAVPQAAGRTRCASAALCSRGGPLGGRAVPPTLQSAVTWICVGRPLTKCQKSQRPTQLHRRDRQRKEHLFPERRFATNYLVYHACPVACVSLASY